MTTSRAKHPVLRVQAPRTAPSRSIGWLALNLFLAVVTGVAICAWLLRYTGIFPEVINLLGLGGLFAGIAFLANLISEDSKKELQGKFESAVLYNHWFPILLLVLAAGFFLLWAPFRGSILVNTAHDERDRTIEI